jgi:hypothetical protein
MNMRNFIGYEIDDVLELVGLRRRRPLLMSVLPAFGLVAFGAAVGASVGLMLAPSSGRRLRQEMGERLDQVRDRVKREAQKQSGANATQQQS